MFGKARVKLTLWYTLIIMLVSASFSFGIYKILTFELDRFERVQKLRIERGMPDRMRMMISAGGVDDSLRLFVIDSHLVDETKRRIGLILFFINSSILVISSVGGYFLAGRTLKPIKEMLDGQYRFISDASHEFRTPLTALRSGIEVGLRDGDLNIQEAREILRSNLEEVESLQTLSDGLLKLAQYQEPAYQMNSETLSLSEVIDLSVRKVEKFLSAKNIKVVNQAENINLEGDQPMLVELLVILLDNAIKYSPENTKIKIGAERADHRIRISISDQGVGIDEEDIPHLFERFYRADKSRTKFSTSGYGLGLAIAKKIVERHQGSIKVASEIGKGSVFTVDLPVELGKKRI